MAERARPMAPVARLCIGITGHRTGHPSFARSAAAIAPALAELFDRIDTYCAHAAEIAGRAALAPVRLHSLLATGTDQLAAELAIARRWDLVAPLPFGRPLYRAINALPTTLDDARALIAGAGPADPDVAARAAAIDGLCAAAHLFELAEADDALTALLFDRLAAPDDAATAQRLAAELSGRVALAGRVMIEQSDLIIGVWDGVTSAHVGGTGHTIAAALAMGVPVVHVDPADPAAWRLLRSPEALATRSLRCGSADDAALAALIADALALGTRAAQGASRLDGERWHDDSSRLAHAYRRVEALFGAQRWGEGLRSLKQIYAVPDQAPEAALSALAARPDGCGAPFAAAIDERVVKRFRWVDGVSARLSDLYRSGMIVNFLLSSLAIVGGIAYLPLTGVHGKWGFALFEMALLCAILLITWTGRRRRWHSRWFETRRLAEYLRHAPLLLILGAARSPGRWPRGADSSWPEQYARHALREVGLPPAPMTAPMLRAILTGMIAAHVTAQRDYHTDKARRLTRVHHRLDRLSTTLFGLAVLSVSFYLALRGGVAAGLVAEATVDHLAKWFTLLGVALPTFGAGIAGIRYFGDFERFAAISEVTAQKLTSVEARIAELARAPDTTLSYGDVVALAHATDDIVFAEIENWQSVFGGKHMTVPV